MSEMFGETLLDSSPSRAPVLKFAHWAISTAVGAAGFLAWYFGAPIIFGPAASTKILVTQAILFGGLPFLFYALMISYVYADATHLGFGRATWIALTVVLNLGGLIIYLIYSASKTGNWKRATLPIAYIFEFILVGVMILVPLIYTQVLPKAQLMTFLAAPPPPPPPPPPAAAPVRIIVHHVSMQDLMKAPTVIPKTIEKVKEQQVPQESVGVVGGVPGGVPGGQVGGVLGGMIGGLGNAPPPPPKPTAPKRIRIGGQVESARRIYGPAPEYPQLAKMARIQGTVKLEAVISKDGTIQDLKVLSGHPLLVPSALSAVRQWRYQPTLLNGEPVEVVTEIDVIFTLQD